MCVRLDFQPKIKFKSGDEIKYSHMFMVRWKDI